MKFLKFLLTFCAVATLVSCGSDDPEGEPVPVPPTPSPDSKLELIASTNAIASDGVEACEFTVKMGDVVLTEGVEIYLVDATAPLASPRFTSKKEGDYKFFAAAKGSVSEKITISVLPIIPKLPVDGQPANTAFRRRIMGLQMTGTLCPNCPRMIAALRAFNATPEAEKVLFTAVHAYGDDRILHSPLCAQISQAYGNGGFPALSFNMYNDCYSGSNDIAAAVSKITELVNKQYKNEAKAGLAAATSISGNKIIVNAAVKATVEGSYRVGAWLLEDGVEAKQANGNPDLTAEDKFGIHNNAVRAVAGRPGEYIFTGDMIGKLAAGATGSRVLSLTTSKKWNLKNCKVIVFVTAVDGENPDKFYVTNAILCNLDATTAFEYK
ncbi:MAG: Omp28-related outer membrane protein [Alistipes sp.]